MATWSPMLRFTGGPISESVVNNLSLTFTKRVKGYQARRQGFLLGLKLFTLPTMIAFNLLGRESSVIQAHKMNLAKPRSI